MAEMGIMDFSQENIEAHGIKWGWLKKPKPKGSKIEQEVITRKEFAKRFKAGDIQGFFRFVKDSDDVTLFGEGIVNGKQHNRDYYLDVTCKYFDSIPSEEAEKGRRLSLRKLGMSVGKTASRKVVEEEEEEDIPFSEEGMKELEKESLEEEELDLDLGGEED